MMYVASTLICLASLLIPDAEILPISLTLKFKIAMALSFLVAALPAALLLTASSASPLAKTGRAICTLPSEDAFYSHAAGYEDASPGTILKHREPPCPLGDFGTMPLDLKSAHQIQFRTTNSLGNPDIAITTILVPNNGNSSRLVSFQDIQDASYINCAPSYAMQVGSSWNNTLSKDSSLFEGGLLAQGYTVNIPDYQGSEAAFSSGTQSGQATLDSIRAALSSSNITGIASNNVDIVMWGYSGGSIATEWAAELHHSYAPELKILGAAIGGTVVNLNNTIRSMNKSPYAGLGVAGLWGLYHGYKSKELDKFMDDQLFSENRTEFEKPRHQCAGADFKQFSGNDVFRYLKSGEGFMDSPQISEIIEKTGIMGKHGVPKIPLYFYKAKGDIVSSVEDQNALVKQYCDQGIESLHYVRNGKGSHSTEAIVGSGGAVSFLNDRLEGKAPQKGCKTDDVWMMDLSDGHLDVFGDEIKGQLEAAIGGFEDLPSGMQDLEDDLPSGLGGLSDNLPSGIDDFFGDFDF